MVQGDLRDTLFLLTIWAGGTLAGGLVGRWISKPLVGFLIGATAGLGVAALLVLLLSWFNLAGPETRDLVLLYLPPALMAGLVAAAVRETINLYRQPWKTTEAETTAKSHFRSSNSLGKTGAFCKIPGGEREDIVDRPTPIR